MALAGGKGKKEKKWLNSCPRDATVSRFLTLLSNNPIGFLPLTLALTLFVFFFFSIAQFSLSASFLFPQVPVDACDLFRQLITLLLNVAIKMRLVSIANIISLSLFFFVLRVPSFLVAPCSSSVFFLFHFSPGRRHRDKIKLSSVCDKTSIT
jgi:hypothetical protein